MLALGAPRYYDCMQSEAKADVSCNVILNKQEDKSVPCIFLGYPDVPSHLLFSFFFAVGTAS